MSPKKITWDNNNIKDENDIKIFTKIKKKEKFEFYSDILNTTLQNFENIQKIENYPLTELENMKNNYSTKGYTIKEGNKRFNIT